MEGWWLNEVVVGDVVAVLTWPSLHGHLTSFDVSAGVVVSTQEQAEVVVSMW
jgi:hypothetical protein